MNPILITFGSIEIRWYSFLICLGVVVGMLLLFREGRRFKISTEFLFNLCFWTIIAAFVGARLYYVVFNWDYYSMNLSEIYQIWNGGLAIHGGIIGGLLMILFYCKKYDVVMPKMTDMMVIPLLLGQALGRWGNFFNAEAHGAATTVEKLESMPLPQFVIDGMNIGGVYYQPTFFYESLWCLLGVVILLFFRRYKYLKIGHLTSLYFMWYSVGRFFIEQSRTDSLMIGAFKVAQLVSVAMFVVALIAFMIISRKSRFEDLYNAEYDKPIRF